MMTEEKKDRLLWCWENESGDPETQEWRDGLTEEEQAYADELDERYNGGIAAMCSAILVRERVQARFAPEEIEELETVYDHCFLRTKGGRGYVVRLGQGGDIILEEAS